MKSYTGGTMGSNNRLLVLIITFCLCFWAIFFTYEAQGSEKNSWRTGKDSAYSCVIKLGSCNVIIEELTTQPKLFIGKNVWNGTNSAINIAYKGKHEPTTMSGIWGFGWESNEFILEDCAMGICDEMKWTEYFDSMIFAPGVDENGGDRMIILDPEAIKLGYPVDGGNRVNSYRHSYDISHLIQSNNLESLKQGLIEGAEGKWLKELQADVFIYRQGNGQEDYQGFANSLNWFYLTIIPLIEAHIVLQRNQMYSQEEYNLVHNWLQQRVWVLEQGPMDGTIGDRWGWKLSHESANHESIKKNVAYMLWGIADMNDTYFTAGVNGFEQYYKSMRSNGTFKSEHRKGNGGNYGISSGNEVGQAMIVMSVILHNQGINIQKKYPKIEKFVKWASKNYSNPKVTGLTTNGTFSNSNIEFLGDNPQARNTIGWMFLWDNVFDTTYSSKYADINENSKAMVTYGITSPENLIIN